MLHISKFSFRPRCGALHFRAALEHLHFFKGKMLKNQTVLALSLQPDALTKKGSPHANSQIFFMV
ncbi:hypothetical protein KL86DES1_21846 [uncultured Desulfovibrio sp.]|uniref:Uncharacterized protein n=1 Tax=uncultured Desulfovibrio sp. TaxID=167968 RepID=A0A212L9X5_9BACT|nr:hypothetical protein KL86DES1_21846 [uncultured Desulfovibrio sp.]VZH34742.1 conserved protein of unknown function [Desulfovibrio sp. 86]